MILTASTDSQDPIQLAGAIARDRARLVVVGAVGMSLPRSELGLPSPRATMTGGELGPSSLPR